LKFNPHILNSLGLFNKFDETQVMRVTIFITILSAILFSCGMPKISDPNGLKTIDIHATVHKPYCGGAKPSPDIAAGYNESLKYEKFKLIKGDTIDPKIKPFQEIELDEGGKVKLQLEPGTYLLVHADKFLSLDEFIEKNQPFEKQFYSVMPNSCFEEWKNSVDLLFTVVNDTTIEYRQKAACWTGINPCIEYTGPKAP